VNKIDNLLLTPGQGGIGITPNADTAAFKLTGIPNASGSASTTDFNCAVQSMHVLLPDISEETLQTELAPYTTNNQTSLVGMEKVAQQHGLNYWAAQIDYSSMMGNTPMVAHMSDNHYVTVTQATPTDVTYIDNGTQVTESRTQFESQWSGNVLAPAGAISAQYDKNQVTISEVYPQNSQSNSGNDQQGAVAQTVTGSQQLQAKDFNGDGVKDAKDLVMAMREANQYYTDNIQPILDTVGITTDDAGHVTAGLDKLNVVSQIDPNDPVVAQYARNVVTTGEVIDLLPDTNTGAVGTGNDSEKPAAQDFNHDNVYDAKDIIAAMKQANDNFSANVQPILNNLGIKTDNAGHITAGKAVFTDATRTSDIEKLGTAINNYLPFVAQVNANIDYVNEHNPTIVKLNAALEGYQVFTDRVTKNINYLNYKINNDLKTAVEAHSVFANRVTKNIDYLNSKINNGLAAKVNEYNTKYVAQVDANVAAAAVSSRQALDKFLKDAGLTPEQTLYMKAAERQMALYEQLVAQYGQEGADTIVAALERFDASMAAARLASQNETSSTNSHLGKRRYMLHK